MRVKQSRLPHGTRWQQCKQYGEVDKHLCDHLKPTMRETKQMAGRAVFSPFHVHSFANDHQRSPSQGSVGSEVACLRLGLAGCVCATVALPTVVGVTVMTAPLEEAEEEEEECLSGCAVFWCGRSLGSLAEAEAE